MADAAPVSIRERKYIRNPLLNRRQFVLEVTHPGKANLSRVELKAQLTKVRRPAATESKAAPVPRWRARAQ